MPLLVIEDPETRMDMDMEEGAAIESKKHTHTRRGNEHEKAARGKQRI